MPTPPCRAGSREAAPLRGNYTTKEALQTVLGGSGLSYEFVGENMVAVKDAPVEDAEDTKRTALPEMTVTASPLDETSYNVPNGTTATKTDTPIMETPVSIQVVPQQVLKDQQAINLQDALKNVSGVVPSFAFSYRETFTIRGFQVGSTLYRDGVRTTETRQPLAIAERVEVVKGTGSMLFGRIEPGGLVNLVTKRPLTEPYYSLSQQFGSFDTYRTLLDATGPLIPDGSVSYRLNFEYLDQDSFRDFVTIDRKLVAPSLTWRNDSTQVDLDFIYQDEDNFIDDGIPAIGNRPAKVPRERFLGEVFSDTNTVNHVPALTVTHNFNDDWKVRARYQAEVTDGFYTGIEPFSLDETTGDAVRFSFIGRFDVDSHFGTLDVTGQFSTWGLDHTLLIGGNYYWSEYLEIDNFFDSPPFASPINIFNPVYGTITDRFKQEPPNSSFGFRDEWYGLYLQDQIALGEQWHLLAGVRYDDARATDFLGGLPPELGPPNEDDAFSPRVGLLYHPLSWLSFYGSYSEGFNSANEGSLPPQLSEQYEAGLKTDLLDGRLSGTLTYFDLTRTNIGTPTGIPNVFDVSGEVQNRGVEFDVSGALTDHWRLIGSFSYIDSEITKDRDSAGGSGDQGNRLVNVPRYSGSLWTVYDFGVLGWPGLTAGAGTFFVGQREGDNANTFQLPGYGRVDLLLGYSRRIGPTQVSVQLNVENLLDKEYFASTSNRLNIMPGAPRTFLGQILVEF